MLTDAEKDACVILSDFFLDTELTPADLHTIAASLQRLSLSVSPKPSSPIRCIPHPISKSDERCWDMGCICSGLASQSNRKQAVDPSRLGKASTRLLRMATRREIMCHACVGSG